MAKTRDVFTTGQVARICKVAPRTVSKWFDNGQLKGYRIPGSKDRRIPRDLLIQFMRTHGIPLNGMESEQTSILVLDNDSGANGLRNSTLASEGRYEVWYARTAFEAGVAVESHKPAVLIVDVSLPDVNPEQLCRDLRACGNQSDLKLIAAGAKMADGTGQAMLQAGFDAVVSKPYDVAELVKVIEKATQRH